MSDRLRAAYADNANRPVVLILDRNTPGRRRLSYHLKRQPNAPYNVQSIDLLDPVEAVNMAPFVEKTAVCLFGLAQARALEHHVWPDKTTFFLLGDENDEHTVNRYQRISELSARILPNQAEVSVQDDMTRDEPHIDLILSYDRVVRDRWLEELLDERVTDMKETYLLPLMPTFLVPNLETQEDGETLADFLLALAADPMIEQNALGRCFFRHTKGYLLPRLPERSDDLVTANPSLLLALIEKLRDRIIQSPAGALGIVICDGLPLSVVAHLAAFADRLWIDGANQASTSAMLARREIGLLLNSIPSSCRVYEIRAKESVY